MVDHEKAIGLLKSRIAKLGAENFDLEAWKAGTIVTLDRVFGSDSQKAREIEKIKYEQSSWALRDAKGSERLIDSCKRRGSEILEVAIEELEYFEPEDTETNQKKDVIHEVIIGALENELKVAQLQKVKKLLEADLEDKEMREKIIGMLNDFGHETVPNVLGFILCHPHIRKVIF